MSKPHMIDLPQMGGRILSCPDFALICRQDALLGWEASAGDRLFQEEVVLQSHSGEVLGVSEFLRGNWSIYGGERPVWIGIWANSPLAGALRPRKTEALVSPALSNRHRLTSPSRGTLLGAGDPLPQSPGPLRAFDCSLCCQEKGVFPESRRHVSTSRAALIVFHDNSFLCLPARRTECKLRFSLRWESEPSKEHPPST